MIIEEEIITYPHGENDTPLIRRWRLMFYEKFTSMEFSLLPNIEIGWTNDRPVMRVEFMFWGVVLWSDLRYS